MHSQAEEKVRFPVGGNDLITGYKKPLVVTMQHGSSFSQSGTI
jgi:hypothetical protein